MRKVLDTIRETLHLHRHEDDQRQKLDPYLTWMRGEEISSRQAADKNRRHMIEDQLLARRRGKRDGEHDE